MGLVGDPGQALVVVEQHAGEGADRDPGQGAVVATAAATHPGAVDGHREAGHEHDVRAGDRVDAEPATARLQQPAAGRLQQRRALVERPVEVVVGQQHRQDHPLAGRGQRVEEGAGAGLRADRDVRRHGGRAAYLRVREQVGRDRPRGLAHLEQRTPRAGGDELVTER